MDQLAYQVQKEITMASQGVRGSPSNCKINLHWLQKVHFAKEDTVKGIKLNQTTLIPHNRLYFLPVCITHTQKAYKRECVLWRPKAHHRDLILTRKWHLHYGCNICGLESKSYILCPIKEWICRIYINKRAKRIGSVIKSGLGGWGVKGCQRLRCQRAGLIKQERIFVFHRAPLKFTPKSLFHSLLPSIASIALNSRFSSSKRLSRSCSFSLGML